MFPLQNNELDLDVFYKKSNIPKISLGDKVKVIIYLELPKEIIKSTLQTHQRYFTLIDLKDRMLNEFIIVANNKDEKKTNKNWK